MRIGLPEMLIVLFIVILIFGASRLPELGRGIGRGRDRTGRRDVARRLLGDLGASKIVAREELSRPSDKQLQRGAYGGGIDTVGGRTLVNLINSTVKGGAVAACGLVSGVDLPANIYPFILRGVALLGVDSQDAPLPDRERIWRSLADEWQAGGFEPLLVGVTEVELDDLEPQVEAILAGEVLGRVIVRIH